MSNQIQGNGEPVDDQARAKDAAPEVISVARRWIVKAGLAAPVILTLRSKPLFGQTPTPATAVKCTAWMSAARLSASYQLSHHMTNPGPVPTQCQQQNQNNQH
jgi:hypothetical protein